MESFVRGFSSSMEPDVQKHMKNVYGAVSIACGSAGIGAFVHLYGSVIGAGLLTSIGAIACLMGLLATPHERKNEPTRLGLLGGFGFLSGVNIGPLLEISIMINPTIMMEALLATTLVFASFSLAAIFAPRGQYLYLGGILTSVLNTLFWFSLFNIFIGSTLIYQANLYIGLVVMCGFIVYDTQAIMEKRRAGDRDYISHGVMLFIDFISVLRKLIVILSQQESKKKEQKRRN